ncbi:MAG: transglycosylase SLT domain-containing protein [Gammaproteobacteria bacterium]|nr:transglycosylase SLT domain-containing protein [Gammaproteobacteria bacterium]
MSDPDSLNRRAIARNVAQGYRSRMQRRLTFITLALLALALARAACGADLPGDGRELEPARAAFRAAWPVAERGDWSAAEQDGAVLEPYLLWPDLRAAWYRANIANADHAGVEAFLNRYGLLKPARELRYRYALHLAEEGRLAEYLSVYQQFYQGLGIAKLDCLALQAELEAGRDRRIVSRGQALWLVGKNQEDECDPVFANLRSRGLLTNEQYAERFELAILARQFSLARYLSGPLPQGYRAQADAWIAAQNDPLGFAERVDVRRDEAVDRRQLAYAIEQVAYRDPLAARTRWDALLRRFSFDRQSKADVSRHIALWSARLHQPEAAGLLAALSAEAANVETGRWLVRAKLLRKEWPEVVRAIDALPPDESGLDEWQYWQAIALGEQGQYEASVTILAGLAGERSYYGFLAADAINADYAFDRAGISVDAGVASALTDIPELMRARELYFVGQASRGRSEWDAAIGQLTNEQQLQAALLAHEWGWHSRAIATIAKAGEFDDLEIRYPLPWRDDFNRYSSSAGISDSWAYGVARSESLFMSDIRSSAGAVGIMQLMPATGRQTAREIRMPYQGTATLTDSTSNIRLGTHYLGQMYQRYADNRVLATAAYNAGPHRVDSWLPDQGSLDARIWIENIPYNETRGYVRRVLTDEAIFHWRLTGRLRRISDEMPAISATAVRVATNN